MKKYGVYGESKKEMLKMGKDSLVEMAATLLFWEMVERKKVPACVDSQKMASYGKFIDWLVYGNGKDLKGLCRYKKDELVQLDGQIRYIIRERKAGRVVAESVDENGDRCVCYMIENLIKNLVADYIEKYGEKDSVVEMESSSSSSVVEKDIVVEKESVVEMKDMEKDSGWVELETWKDSENSVEKVENLLEEAPYLDENSCENRDFDCKNSGYYGVKVEKFPLESEILLPGFSWGQFREKYHFENDWWKYVPAHDPDIKRILFYLENGMKYKMSTLINLIADLEFSLDEIDGKCVEKDREKYHDRSFERYGKMKKKELSALYAVLSKMYFGKGKDSKKVESGSVEKVDSSSVVEKDSSVVEKDSSVDSSSSVVEKADSVVDSSVVVEKDSSVAKKESVVELDRVELDIDMEKVDSSGSVDIDSSSVDIDSGAAGLDSLELELDIDIGKVDSVELDSGGSSSSSVDIDDMVVEKEKGSSVDMVGGKVFSSGSWVAPVDRLIYSGGSLILC